MQYWEGAGTFGNGPARYDAGEAAAVISQLAGSPVRLQFMRWDEHGWDNYGPAHPLGHAWGVDASGNMTALDDTRSAIPSLSIGDRRDDAEHRHPLRTRRHRQRRRDQLRLAVRGRRTAA